ncbi:hypothetical protein HY212_07695 [Candidatus Pacearchaeota archaeon]|nr:hypothetical protein [Candidatus Pacearchaeota archaeon]
MANRLELWRGSSRDFPSYSVRYYNSEDNLKEVFTTSIFLDPNEGFVVGLAKFHSRSPKRGVRISLGSYEEHYGDLINADLAAYGLARKFGEEIKSKRKIRDFADFTKNDSKPSRSRNKTKKG